MGKPLSIFDQARLLRKRFPDTALRVRREGSAHILAARLHLRPGAWCDQYRVGILYAFGHRPRVWVLSPQPVLFAHGQVTPHLNADFTLCLYDPHGDEWGPDRSIADTTVPWTSLWLMYYEDWLETGDWKGGGAPMPEVVSWQPTQPNSETES